MPKRLMGGSPAKAECGRRYAADANGGKLVRGWFAEMLADERKPSAAAFLDHAARYYRDLDVRVRCIMTDNAKVFRSLRFTAAALGLAIGARRTGVGATASITAARPAATESSAKELSAICGDGQRRGERDCSHRGLSTLKPVWVHRCGEARRVRFLRIVKHGSEALGKRHIR